MTFRAALPIRRGLLGMDVLPTMAGASAPWGGVSKDTRTNGGLLAGVGAVL